MPGEVERKVSAVKSFPKPHREKLEGEEYLKFTRSIFGRDRWMCRRCGVRNSLTPHHIIRRSQLGGDTPGNVITVCLPCHEQIERNELKVQVVDVVIMFKKVE